MGGQTADEPGTSPTATSTGHQQHREKSTKANRPLWCGLLTRLIKPSSDEFKSPPCQDSQSDEKTKLEKKEVWDDYSTVREWGSVSSDPAFVEATVARVFVIMGLKNEEMLK
eukprot:13266505-Heterocapsa_arctica.AAC.1